MSAAACDANDPYGRRVGRVFVAILCGRARHGARRAFCLHAEIEDEIEALEKGQRHNCTRNQHANSTQTTRHQHVISTQSARNQHAISTQSACNGGPRERAVQHTSHLTRSIALHLGAAAAIAARRRRTREPAATGRARVRCGKARGCLRGREHGGRWLVERLIGSQATRA